MYAEGQENKAAWSTFDLRHHIVLGVTASSTCSSATPQSSSLAANSTALRFRTRCVQTPGPERPREPCVRPPAGEVAMAFIQLREQQPLNSCDLGIRAGKLLPSAGLAREGAPAAGAALDPPRPRWPVALMPFTQWASLPRAPIDSFLHPVLLNSL